MIRTKGAAGTGDVIQAVEHVRTIKEEIDNLKSMSENVLRMVINLINDHKNKF